MNPTNNQIIEKNDLKESVEALLGAGYKIHGFDKPKSIISSLVKEVDTTNISLDINYIGLLQKFAQKNKYQNPEYNDSDNLGTPNEAIFYCTIKFQGLEVTSDSFGKKLKPEKMQHTKCF